MVWDKLHNFEVSTRLDDIDLIYFDPDFIFLERELEYQLKEMLNLPWSVKNQARMHTRNGDKPYHSTYDAMSYWVEVETAVGAKINQGEIEIIAPLGVKNLFSNSITINPKRPKIDDFYSRLSTKKWLEKWPNLKVRAPKYCGS